VLTINHFSINSQTNTICPIDKINPTSIKKFACLFDSSKFRLDNYDKFLQGHYLQLEKIGLHSRLLSIYKDSSTELISIGLFSNGMDSNALAHFIDRCGNIEPFLNRPEEPFMLSYIFNYRECNMIETIYELETNIAFAILDTHLELF